MFVNGAATSLFHQLHRVFLGIRVTINDHETVLIVSNVESTPRSSDPEKKRRCVLSTSCGHQGRFESVHFGLVA